VLLQTDTVSNAISFLNQRSDIEVVNENKNGYIEIQCTELNSAELNRQLVQNEIAVSELLLQKASLGNLFRSITSGEQA